MVLKKVTMLGKLYAFTFCLQLASVLNSLNDEENMISCYLTNEKVRPFGILVEWTIVLLVQSVM